MFRTFRKYATIVCLVILAILGAEGYASARAHNLHQVARHLYLVHAENFYCAQPLPVWENLCDGQSAACLQITLFKTDVYTLRDATIHASQFMILSRYERDTFYERELINAP